MPKSFAVGLGLMACAVGSGWAQGNLSAEAPSVAASDAQEGPERSRQPQQVVVTASRRAEAVQDVAASVNVLRGARLGELGAQSLQDYAGHIAAFQTIGDRPGYTQHSLRGITTGFLQLAATVGVYIDEAPTTFSSSYGSGALITLDPDTFDLERIEVLKGPQGAVYGANSLAGLIKYVTVAPDLRRLEGRVELGARASDGHGTGGSVRAVLNAPIKEDTLASRLLLYRRVEPGYISNTRAGDDDVNEAGLWGGRVSTLLQLNPQFSARLTTEKQVISVRDAAVVSVDPATLQPSAGDLETMNKLGTPSRADNLRHNLLLNYDAGFAELLSSTSFSHQTGRYVVDLTNSHAALYAAPFGADTVGFFTQPAYKKTTQEFRLTSASGPVFDWLAGLFMDRQTVDSPLAIRIFSGPPGGPFVEFPTVLRGSLVAALEETAAFGSGTWKLSDATDIQFGARLSRIAQTYGQEKYELFGVPQGDVPSVSVTESNFTYFLSPRHRFSNSHMAYLRVATGYRPGGPNLVFPGSNVPSRFSSDGLTSAEVGFRGLEFGSRLSYSLALHHTRWSEIQVNSVDPTTGFIFYANGGRAHVEGVEAEADWQPTSSFRMMGALSWMRARLDGDIAVVGAQARAGDELPYIPRFTGSISADYRMPLGGGWSGSVGTSYRYVGKRKAQFSSQPIGFGTTVIPADLGAYEVVELRAGVDGPGWSLSLLAKNIFDERGALALSPIGVGPGATSSTTSPAPLTVIPPRTYELALQVRF